MLLLASCRKGEETNRVLAESEALMNEYPDSSLVILQALDISQIKTQAAKAKYSLLYSMALDKNRIDVKSDSIIKVAVDYYSSREDSEDLFLSYYYCGRVHYNNNEYSKALLFYAKAEAMENNIDNDFAKGLLYARTGSIYDKLYVFPKSLDYYIKSYNCYIEAKTIPHQYYSLESIAKLYLQMKEYAKADSTIHVILDWEDINNYQWLIKDCCNMLVSLYKEIGDAKALSLLSNDKRYSKYCSRVELSVDAVPQFVKTSLANAKNISDTAACYFEVYKTFKKNRIYPEALSYYEKVFRLQDSVVRVTLQQPILSSQRDYYQAETEIAEYKLLQFRYRAIFIALLSLAVAVGIALYFRNNLKHKNAMICAYMDKIVGMQDSLYDKDAEIEQISGAVNELFKGQFTLLDDLCKAYYENHGIKTVREEDAIYKKVKGEIEQFAEGKLHIEELECLVNKYRANVMSLIRQQMKQLSEQDYLLLCYLYAGFSAKAISVFTDNSIGNIYTKKSRIKEEIRNSHPQDEALMLKWLE